MKGVLGNRYRVLRRRFLCIYRYSFVCPLPRIQSSWLEARYPKPIFGFSPEFLLSCDRIQKIVLTQKHSAKEKTCFFRQHDDPILMKIVPRFILLIFVWLCLADFVCFAQKPEKLEERLNQLPEDTVKIAAYEKLIRLYEKRLPAKARQYAEAERDLSEKLNYPKGRMLALKSLGLTELVQGEFAMALEYEMKALELAQQLPDRSEIAESLHLIGVIYQYKSNYTRALDYYFQALNLREQLQDKKGVSTTNGAIGNIFKLQGDTDKALSYLQKALAIDEQIGDRTGRAYSLNDLGSIYLSRRQLPQAIEHLLRANAYLENSGDKMELVHNLESLSEAYTLQNSPEEGLAFARRAFTLADSAGFISEKSQALTRIARIYQSLNQPKLALIFGEKAITLAQQVNSYQDVQPAATLLAETHKQLGHFKRSVEYMEMAATAKDSVFTLEKSRITDELENSYQMTKKQNEIEVLTRMRQLSEDELRQQTFQRNVLLVLLVLLLAGGVALGRVLHLLWRSNRVQYVQQTEILQKNTEMEQQQEEILAQAENLREANREIQIKNEELQVINETLDQKVRERTLVLKQQNRQLREFGYINAHKLRAPVASILGLVQLLQTNTLSEADTEILGHLLTASRQLDSIVHEIQVTIEPFYPNQYREETEKSPQ
jgi:tetratricopeptide (TPR) repeat protein